MAFTYGIGKGLREPCSPHREIMIFGAELNPDLSELELWHCAPEILYPTTSFDLSGITINHEVVVANVKFPITAGETVYFDYKWYRDRDNKLLFHFSTSLTALVKGIAWCPVYIGYVDWEIIENGDYHVDIEVTGDHKGSHTFNFLVSGILMPVAPPELPTDWLLDIRKYVNIAAAWCLWIKNEVESWWTPFNLLAEPFDQFYRVLYWVAKALTTAHEWTSEVASKVMAILSWDTIWSYIKRSIPNWDKIGEWFEGWASKVVSLVTDTGSVIRTAIESWIAVVKDWAKNWIDYLQGEIDELRIDLDNLIARIPDLTELLSWFSNWWGNILIRLHYWWAERKTEIQELIDTAFKIREDLWAGWQDWRDSVVEFFTDPVEFVWARFTDWFLGPEE